MACEQETKAYDSWQAAFGASTASIKALSDKLAATTSAEERAALTLVLQTTVKTHNEAIVPPYNAAVAALNDCQKKSSSGNVTLYVAGGLVLLGIVAYSLSVKKG